MCAQTPSAPPPSPPPQPSALRPPPRPQLGSVSAIVALGWGFPVFYKYVEASNVCPNPFPAHRPHRPHRFVHPHRPNHSTSFGSLPLSRPGCPWFGFSRPLEVFKGFQCVPKPPPPQPLYVVRVSAIVPTWLPLVRVFTSFRSI